MTEPRKILIYTDEGSAGGVAQYNHALALALAEKGWSVAMAFPSNESPLVDEQKARGIIHRHLSYSPKHEFTRSFVDTADPKAIYAELSPDLIFFSDCCPLSNLAAKSTSISSKIPFIIQCHSGAAYLADRFTAATRVARLQYNAAQAVIAISPASLEILRRVYGLASNRGMTVLNGRPRHYFEKTPTETRRRIRDELGLSSDAVLSFTSARFDRDKGYHLQLAAIAVLIKNHALGPLHFAWAGVGEGFDDIRNMAANLGVAEQISFLGQRWDVDDLLGSSDLFVLPSFNEGGLPLSAMEAMAKGLPTIISAINSIPAIVGDAGVLIPDPNQNANATIATLASALKSLGSSSTLRERIGKAAGLLARRSFDLSTNLARTVSVIEGIVPSQ